MKDLKLTEEYLLCTMNKKGMISLSDEYAIALGASALIELLHQGFIAIEDKKVVIKKDLTDEYKYLSAVYEVIQTHKPMNAKNIGELLFFSSKNMKRLFSDTKSLLEKDGCLVKKTGEGFFKRRTVLVANENCVNSIVEKIRAELLEDGSIDENMLALVSLLEHTSIIKNYFSKHEQDRFRLRLKEIKKDEKYKLITEIIDYTEAIFVSIIVAATV